MALKGYKQSAEHVGKRIKRGPEHHAWLGDSVSDRGGRARALRIFAPGPCSACGSDVGERHHKDGNTANNSTGNVEMLCRRCHMESDGRLARLSVSAAASAPKRIEAAANEKRSRTQCKRGHALSGDNLYTNRGKRICRACQKLAVAKYRQRIESA